MKTSTFPLTVAALAVAAVGFAQTAARPEGHQIFAPETLTWGPAPPSLPVGAQMAVLEGDPRQAGPFTLRVKLPAGYAIAPHWHPTAEHLTLISGEAAVGMGDTVDAASMQTMKPGAFTVMPAGMRHYMRVKAETIVQVHGTGPFTVTYVNPKDDPRGAAAPASK